MTPIVILKPQKNTLVSREIKAEATASSLHSRKAINTAIPARTNL